MRYMLRMDSIGELIVILFMVTVSFHSDVKEG